MHFLQIFLLFLQNRRWIHSLSPLFAMTVQGEFRKRSHCSVIYVVNIIKFVGSTGFSRVLSVTERFSVLVVHFAYNFC